MQLIRDVLDKQLCTRGGQRAGRVDGVVAELRDGAPPRVACLLVGPTTLARRFGPGPARWLAAFLGRHGPRVAAPTRIPWRDVIRVGITVTVDLDAERSPTLAWERWLREHVVARIPGG